MNRVMLPDPMGRLTLFKGTPLHDSVESLYSVTSLVGQVIDVDRNYLYRSLRDEKYPVPINALQGTLSRLEPRVGSAKASQTFFQVYDQETPIWIARAESKNKPPGDVYFISSENTYLIRSHAADAVGIQSQEEFKNNFQEAYQMQLPRYALVRARSAKAARMGFANFLSWETPYREYYDDNEVSAYTIVRGFEHFLIPKDLQKLMDSVAELLIANRTQMLDRENKLALVRYKVELRLEVIFSAGDPLGLEASGLLGSSVHRDLVRTRQQYLARARKKFKLLPTLVGDDGIGVAFQDYAEATDAIASWVQAIRSGTDLVTIRRKIREDRK